MKKPVLSRRWKSDGKYDGWYKNMTLFGIKGPVESFRFENLGVFIVSIASSTYTARIIIRLHVLQRMATGSEQREDSLRGTARSLGQTWPHGPVCSMSTSCETYARMECGLQKDNFHFVGQVHFWPSCKIGTQHSWTLTWTTIRTACLNLALNTEVKI